MSPKNLEAWADLDRQNQARITELEAKNARLMDELGELQQTFDLRWKADQRAIKRWQAATGKGETWPDHADLCVWLLEHIDRAEALSRTGAVKLDVDVLAQEIRRVDGNHDLGAGALAEALMPFLSALEPAAPEGQQGECPDCGSPLNEDGECLRDLAEQEADDRAEAEYHASLREQDAPEGQQPVAVEALAEFLCSEFDFDLDPITGASWPEHENDDGYRGGRSFVRLQPSDVQARARENAARILTFLKQQTTRPPEQAVTEAGIEAAARLITKWLGFAWDGLHDGCVTDKGFKVFTHGQFGWHFQGHKGDMVDLARVALKAAMEAGHEQGG